MIPLPGAGQWEKRVDQALTNLGDRSVLNRSSLARLTYIERLVEDKCRGHILPRGLVLHDVLIDCVNRYLKS